MWNYFMDSVKDRKRLERNAKARKNYWDNREKILKQRSALGKVQRRSYKLLKANHSFVEACLEMQAAV